MAKANRERTPKFTNQSVPSPAKYYDTFNMFHAPLSDNLIDVETEDAKAAYDYTMILFTNHGPGALALLPEHILKDALSYSASYVALASDVGLWDALINTIEAYRRLE